MSDILSSRPATDWKGRGLFSTSCRSVSGWTLYTWSSFSRFLNWMSIILSFGQSVRLFLGFHPPLEECILFFEGECIWNVFSSNDFSDAIFPFAFI